MKVGARARLMMVVMLGIVAGLGFIALPGILAMPGSALTPTTTTDTNSTSYGASATSVSDNSTIRSANNTKTQTPAETAITGGTLSVLVSLIVIPALILSLVTSTLVSRSARKGLDDTSEDKPSQE